jgi:coproporphyrinogen III oxidase-like Fe-S oxidoreductase
MAAGPVLEELAQVVERQERGTALWDLFDSRIHVHPYRLPPFVAEQEAEQIPASEAIASAWDPARPKLIYLHVPFCSSICPYCPFSKQQYDGSASDAYFDDLVRHLTRVRSGLTDEEITAGATPSLYFGGGSPSTLRPSQLLELIATVRALFRLDDDAEVTVELRIADIDDAYLSTVIDSGLVNRLSFGVQSFSKDLRASVGRQSDPERVKEVVAASVQRVAAVNVDLMYGLPNQTMDDWRSDLETALSLQATACSTYRLNVHSSTKFGVLSRRGGLGPVPQAALENEMWSFAEDLLVDTMGWTPFTPANYGRFPEERGVYNARQLDTSYDILGLGAGSHGQVGTACYSSPKHAPEFGASLDGDAPVAVHRLNARFMEARDLLSLSVGARVSVASLRRSPLSTAAYDQMVDGGLAAESEGTALLTRQGMYWSRNLYYLSQRLHRDALIDPERAHVPRARRRPEMPEATVPATAVAEGLRVRPKVADQATATDLV